MSDQKNTILAIVLSALVLIVWQVFYGVPHMDKQKQIQQQQAQTQQPPAIPQQTPGASEPQSPPAPGAVPQAPSQAGGVPARTMTRDAALAASPRVRIDTPSLSGSISLKGARIDDLSLVKYRETVDPNSPPIVLLAPSGSPHPFYAEFGWSAPSGASVKLPTADTLWQQQGAGALSVGHPVTLVYDNGEGLQFRRTIAVDDKYLFTIKDEVINNSAAPVTLYPFGLISRHGTPQTLGYYILHEGLIGVFGDKGLQEETYADIEKKKEVFFSATDVWLGITDKYRAGADDRAGQHRRRQRASVRRRQGGRGRRQLRQAAQAQSLRAVDRLGLVLLHHEAAVPVDGLDLSPRRKFRRRHSDRDRHHQDLLLPARQQILRRDGEDEGGAAGNDGDPRALRRRQDEAAAGD